MTGIVCSANEVGYQECACPQCLRDQEEDNYSESLNEIAAGHVYSGASYSEAMQYAREELRARALRAQLPEIRRQFATLRREWVRARGTKAAADLWEQLYALYLDGCEATGRMLWGNEDARRSFAADMTEWARKDRAR